jgi:hypothetical protein
LTSVDPAQDGVDHINVYSKGKTTLGRFLSNFAKAPIDTEDGHFDSIEGYWYWLGLSDAQRTSDQGQQLRFLSGSKAKEHGRAMRAADWHESAPEFKAKICRAIDLKLRDNPEMLRQLRENTLPLVHYYTFRFNPSKPVFPKSGQWVIDHLSSYVIGESV